MARDLTASLVTALTGDTVRAVVFYEGEFSSGTLRFWSGVGQISWNGQTWTGAGNLGSISAIEESSDVRAVGIVCSLSGQSSAILSLVLGAVRQGLEGKVWIGAVDAAGAVVADPFLAFSGFVDVPDTLDEGESATISIRYESRLIDLDKTRERRYTDEDQQIDYAGDSGFAFVPALQDAQITWGVGRGVPATAPAAAALPTAPTGYRDTPEGPRPYYGDPVVGPGGDLIYRDAGQVFGEAGDPGL